MQDDPIVAEVRRTRERLSEQFDFDVSAVFADLRKRQTELGPRLVRRSKEDRTERSTVADENSKTLRPGR